MSSAQPLIMSVAYSTVCMSPVSPALPAGRGSLPANQLHSHNA